MPVSLRKIDRTKKPFAEEGLDAALGRRKRDRVWAHFLPASAFELMPAKGFNAQLKVAELRNAANRDKDDLVSWVRRNGRSIQRRRNLCQSFWGQTPLAV